MKYQNENTNRQLITDYLMNGGTITICKPKLVTKSKPSRRKVLTRDQMKSAIGQHPLFIRAA